MNPHIQNRRNHALTRFEVLVAVLLVILVFVLLLAALPVYVASHRRSARIECLYNLEQISMGLRTWQGDRDPETLSTAKSIPAGLNSGQLAWVDAMGLSNVLHSTKILRCPFDTENPQTNPDFPVKISYFLNLDARETYPQMILSSDDDLVIGDGKHLRPTDNAAEGDVPVIPGILQITTNTVIAWGKRHGYMGNISFADGSVAEESAYGLMNAFQYNFNGTPATTNRLAIP